MRIFSAIKTLGRKTAGKVADNLSRLSECVTVVSFGATVETKSSNTKIIEVFGTDKAEAENILIQEFLASDCDIYLSCDDDIIVPEVSALASAKIVSEIQSAGIVSIPDRKTFFYQSKVTCNRGFKLTTNISKIWIARREVVKEVGWFRFPFAEDRDFMVRAYRAGFAVVSLSESVEQSCRSLSSKEDLSDFSNFIRTKEKQKKAMISFFRANKPLVSLEPENPSEKNPFIVKYDWNQLLLIVVKRFGVSVGYEDSLGRRF